MSRHRYIKQLEKDYYEDEYDHDYDDYEEDENIEQVEEEEKWEKITEIYDLTEGKFSEDHIEKALESFNWNLEKTIDYLLSQLDSLNHNNEIVEPQPSIKIENDENEDNEFATILSSSSKVETKTFNMAQYIQSTKAELLPFDFKTPSPDDLVIQARKKAEQNRMKKLKPTKEVNNKQQQEQLQSEIGKLNIKSSGKPIQKKKLKKIDFQIEFRKRNEQFPSLNLVVVGHVDAGKSTLMGHLLHLSGEIEGKIIEKYKRDSQRIGKSSFAFAWVMDENKEERERGVTIDVGMGNFKTKNRQFTILDSPGHRDFIPNMITGASQADVALLVVDAVSGAFESGFQSNGQTKEHSFLVRSLGVQQIIVAVNKMDTVAWEKDRFDQIVQELSQFLVKQVGFRSKNLYFLPCSGVTGENLKELTASCSWYTGMPLLNLFDQLPMPERPISLPLVFLVISTFKSANNYAGSIDLYIQGKVIQGHLQNDQVIEFSPYKIPVIVSSIELNHEKVEWACAGDLITVGVTAKDLEEGMIVAGCVGTEENQTVVQLAKSFEAQLVVFDIQRPLLNGSSVLFHRHSLNEPAVITKLINIIDKNTGEVKNTRPRAIPSQSSATVEITLDIGDRNICLETFSILKDLGRFMLRMNGKTIAAGIITKIIK